MSICHTQQKETEFFASSHLVRSLTCVNLRSLTRCARSRDHPSSDHPLGHVAIRPRTTRRVGKTRFLINNQTIRPFIGRSAIVQMVQDNNNLKGDDNVKATHSD